MATKRNLIPCNLSARLTFTICSEVLHLTDKHTEIIRTITKIFKIYFGSGLYRVKLIFLRAGELFMMSGA